MNTHLNTGAKQFANTFDSAMRSVEHAHELRKHEKTIHVANAGRTLSLAYEQLRNAAEYTEEHLLLQRAIRRFYKRLFLTRDEKRTKGSGEELVIELTLAGYLHNDSISVGTLEKIDNLAPLYFKIYTQYANEAWSLDVLAVEVERLIHDDTKQAIFAQFAYDYFHTTLDPSIVPESARADFDIMLFIAVERALLKYDTATIRASLLRRYQQYPPAVAYAPTNEMIDRLTTSKTTEKIYKLVSRRGAPLRVLWRLLDEHNSIHELMASREKFLYAYEAQITSEYKQIHTNINNGIIKSVLFLAITKVLVGLAIEIPYDYLVHGAIIWLPLAINLLFPPLYMIMLRLTLKSPDYTNTRALSDAMDDMLYSDDSNVVAVARSGSKGGFNRTFNALYSIFFMSVVGGVIWLLFSLGFSIIHIGIFFIFLSTASFLGFRLSRQIREIEIVDGPQDGVTMLRDFLYLPFVMIGSWISDKYARVNIIAMILDMVIELPLKTVLHLVRQWGAFISSKKDEL